MKRSMRKQVVAAFIFILLMVNVISVQAATSISGIKKLVNQMYYYEYSVLPIQKKTNMKLSQQEKAKAVALSLSIKESNGIEKGEFGGYELFKVDTASFKKASLDMFGKKLSISSLPKQTEAGGLMDAYRLKKDGTPVVYCMNGETECDFVVHSTKITKKSSKTVSVVRNIYFGYWGNNDGHSNYKITYTVQKNSKSDYGFVITKMVVEPLS